MNIKQALWKKRATPDGMYTLLHLDEETLHYEPAVFDLTGMQVDECLLKLMIAGLCYAH